MDWNLEGGYWWHARQGLCRIGSNHAMDVVRNPSKFGSCTEEADLTIHRLSLRESERRQLPVDDVLAEMRGGRWIDASPDILGIAIRNRWVRVRCDAPHFINRTVSFTGLKSSVVKALVEFSQHETSYEYVETQVTDDTGVEVRLRIWRPVSLLQPHINSLR